MYEGRQFLGFARSDGTKWCKKNQNGDNIDVALVRKNGDIIWYLPEKNQPKAIVEKIIKNSMVEKKKINFWQEELKKTEKKLSLLKSDSYEYANLMYNFLWYKEALYHALPK